MFRLPLLAIIFWLGLGLSLGWIMSIKYHDNQLAMDTPPPLREKTQADQNLTQQIDNNKLLQNTVGRILQKYEDGNIFQGRITATERGILESSTQKLIDSNTADARNILRRWLDSDPYDPQAMFLMAQTHAKAEEYDQALEIALILKSYPQIIVSTETIDNFIEEIVEKYTTRLRTNKQFTKLLSVYQKLVQGLLNPAKYYYQLALLQQNLNLHADALISLNYVFYDPTWGQLAQDLAQEIQLKLNLANQIQIPLEQIGEQFIVTATINGVGGIDLLIDTGASICLLRPQAAIQVGLSPEGEQDVLISVASGVANARSITVDSLEIGAARLENVLTSILEMPPGIEADGLLGMNFLGRFNFFIDQNNATLYLGSR